MELEAHCCVMRRSPLALILIVQTVQSLSDPVTAMSRLYIVIRSGLFTAGYLNELLRPYSPPPAHSLCVYLSLNLPTVLSTLFGKLHDLPLYIVTEVRKTVAAKLDAAIELHVGVVKQLCFMPWRSGFHITGT
jgi:hypothetical protein